MGEKDSVAPAQRACRAHAKAPRGLQTSARPSPHQMLVTPWGLGLHSTQHDGPRLSGYGTSRETWR